MNNFDFLEERFPKYTEAGLSKDEASRLIELELLERDPEVELVESESQLLTSLRSKLQTLMEKGSSETTRDESQQ